MVFESLSCPISERCSGAAVFGKNDDVLVLGSQLKAKVVRWKPEKISVALMRDSPPQDDIHAFHSSVAVSPNGETAVLCVGTTLEICRRSNGSFLLEAFRIVYAEDIAQR